MHNALEKPEHIGRGQDHANCGEARIDGVILVGTQEDQELPDKAIQTRQAKSSQSDQQEDSGQEWRTVRETTQLLQPRRAPTIIDQADDEEERGNNNAVVQQLDGGTLDGLLGEGENSQCDEAKVANTGTGHQAFDIALIERQHGSIDDTDHGQKRDHPGEAMTSSGEERQTETQEAIDTHFREHGRDHNGDRHGRLSIDIGQPGMQRKERGLDSESQAQRQ